MHAIEKIEESVSRSTRRRYLITTLAIYLANIGVASSVNSYSPTMTYYATKYDTNVAAISVGTTLSLVTYLIGAFLVSCIYKFIKRQLGMVIFLFGIAVCVALSSHLPTLMSMYIHSAVIGLCFGAYDTSEIVWMLEMWQDKCGPYLQVLYFFGSVGAFIPGFLMAPFLSQLNAEGQTGDPMWIPFTAIAVYTAVAASVHLLLYIFQPYFPPPPGTSQSEGKHEQTDNAKSSKRLKIACIAFSAVFIAFYTGMDLSSKLYMSTFAQFTDHGLSESQSSILFSALAASISVGSFVGIFAISKIPPIGILTFNFSMLIVANILLLASNVDTLMLWLGAILLGLGLSTVQASFYAYIARYLVVTDVIGSIFLVSAGFVSGVYPIIIGQQISLNPLFYTYTNFFSLSVITITFCIIVWYGRGQRKF